MPKRMPNRKKSSLGDIFFFFGMVVIGCLIVISYITLKNECLTVQGEIYHLRNIHHNHSNHVKMLESDMQGLLRRDFIEAAPAVVAAFNIRNVKDVITFHWEVLILRSVKIT